MTALLIYIGKVALLLVAFYLFYKLLLSRETFHRLGRYVLMGAAPFLHHHGTPDGVDSRRRASLCCACFGIRNAGRWHAESGYGGNWFRSL